MIPEPATEEHIEILDSDDDVSKTVEIISGNINDDNLDRETIDRSDRAGDVALTMDEDIPDEEIQKPITFLDFISMPDVEKASALGIDETFTTSDILERVQAFFRDVNHKADFDEIVDIANTIFNVEKDARIALDVAEAVSAIKEYGYDYSTLMFSEKAMLIPLKIGEPNYSLKLHAEVLKQLGVRMDMDETLSDYQGIYERKLDGDRTEDKKIDRTRGR